VVIYSGVMEQKWHYRFGYYCKKTRWRGDKLAWFLVTECESSKETQNDGVFETRQAMPRDEKKTEAAELLYVMPIRSNKLYSLILKAA